MTGLVGWAWALPLPFIVLGILGLPRRGGAVSFLGPLGVLVLALVGLAHLGGDSFSGGQAVPDVRIDGFLPFLPDDAFVTHPDGLALSMLAVVGMVSTCIYLFALGYMEKDENRHRFFAFLDVFVASMCLLVLAGNITTLLIGWAGVGLASFLLISFWWERPGTLAAGAEALAANAIGDAALLLAIVVLPAGIHSFDDLALAARQGSLVQHDLIAFLLIVAAFAKSAQGPLYFWLPSAMAGPTPVSALLHSATMVAAGVYLGVRVSPVLAVSPEVSRLVLWVGLLTMLFGGLMSLRQDNLKKGLAFSSVSQLGMMFVALGIGAPFAAFFHLVTHAAFKALLFTSAGGVIHGLHGEERISHMGGLRKVLPGPHLFFLIGALSLIGLPILTAGGASKDLILETALHHDRWLGIVLLAAAGLTGAYAGRLYFATFYGSRGHGSRGYGSHGNGEGGDGAEHGDHAVHAPSGWLVWPLVPLALGAIGFGFLEVSGGLLSRALAGVVEAPEPSHVVTGVGLVAGAIGLAGFFVGRLLVPSKATPSPAARPGWVQALVDAFDFLAEKTLAFHTGRTSQYLLATLVTTALAVGFVLTRP